MPACTPAIADAERIGQFILVIRSQRVLIDEDLAALYGVETRSLLQTSVVLPSGAVASSSSEPAERCGRRIRRHGKCCNTRNQGYGRQHRRLR